MRGSMAMRQRQIHDTSRPRPPPPLLFESKTSLLLLWFQVGVRYRDNGGTFRDDVYGAPRATRPHRRGDGGPGAAATVPDGQDKADDAERESHLPHKKTTETKSKARKSEHAQTRAQMDSYVHSITRRSMVNPLLPRCRYMCTRFKLQAIVSQLPPERRSAALTGLRQTPF